MNKITPLEALHFQKMKLQAELESCVNRLNKHAGYIQDNWSSLLVNTVMTTTRSKMPTFLQGFFPSPEKVESSSGRPSSIQQNVGVVVNYLIDILPLLTKGIKPILIRLVLHKVKKILFKQK